MAHFLVVSEGCAAMHQRVVVTFRQTLRFGGNVSLVKIAQKHGSETDDIADAGTVIVPGGAGGLIGFVQVPRAELVHQPKQRGRVSRYIAALAARFVVPELIGGDFLGPAVKRSRSDLLVLLGDAMHDDFAVFLKLAQGVADIFDAILTR